MPKDKNRLYLGGPMRGIPDDNCPAFDAAAKRIRALGFFVVNPAELDRKGPKLRLARRLLRDYAHIEKCGLFAVLRGWETSAGTLAELTFARALDRPPEIIDAETMESLESLDFGVLPVGKSTDWEVFPSGAKRSPRTGKGRCDLLMPRALLRLAKLLEEGGNRCGDRNWELGFPMSCHLDCTLRHAYQYLAALKNEDHLVRLAFNALAALETEERINEGVLPASLQDIPGR